MRKIHGFVIALLLVFAAAALKADFIFWLEGPSRSNANDPKSSLFFPTVTAGAVGTATFTRTVTPTNTPVNTGTSTHTPSPTATPQYDPRDPGDNVFGGATALGSVASAPMSTNDGAHKIGDSGDGYDYYTVVLPAGQTFDITVTRNSGTVNMLLEVADNAAMTSASSNTAASPQLLGFAGTGVTYYIRVSTATAGVDDYTLTVTNVTGATPTFTPSYSPINTSTFTSTITDSPTQSFTASPTFTIALNTPTSTATPTTFVPPSVNKVIFDDMENPPCGAYTYSDGSTTVLAPVQDATQFYSGANSYFHSNDQGTVWGSGIGFGAMGGCISIDATSISPTHVYMWVKTDQNVNLWLTFNEDAAAQGGVAEEHWTSPQIFVTASPSWQLVEATIASFTPNNYFHVTLGNPMDNSIFNPIVNNFDLQFGAKLPENTAPANFYFDEIGFADGSQGIPPAPTPTPVPGGVEYSNLESPVVGAYSYTDGGGSTISYAQTNADKNSGAQSYRFTVSNSAGTWGAGGGFNRPGGTAVNATGMTKMRYYYKTDQAAAVIFSLTEMNVAGVDPTNEQWVSSAQPLSTVGAWTMAEVNLADFATESIYNTQCATSPDCTSTGNNAFDINVIFGMDFQFPNSVPVTGATIYFDDITFLP